MRKTSFEMWHSGAGNEIGYYARSLQDAAKTLLGKLEADGHGRADWQVCPVILLYRQALELHLKSLVGEGSIYLKNPTDRISLSTTHSLRWLAQIVCQIVRATGRTSEFTCEGVTSLADFSALVDEVESLNPVTRAIRAPRAVGLHAVTEYYRTFDAAKFARKLDGLLDLLESTASALGGDGPESGELFKGDFAFK